jgi:hypothetical protein
MLWCLLIVYCKRVYATCFDLYLGHHQANTIKQTKLSEFNCLNMDPYYAVFGPPLWSSGQSSSLQIQRSRV